MTVPSFRHDAETYCAEGYGYLLRLLFPAADRAAALADADTCFEAAARNFRFSEISHD